MSDGCDILLNYILHYEKTKRFLGIRVRVHGKFQGILRKRNFKIYDKYISLHVIKNYVYTKHSKIYSIFFSFL